MVRRGAQLAIRAVELVLDVGGFEALGGGGGGRRGGFAAGVAGAEGGELAADFRDGPLSEGAEGGEAAAHDAGGDFGGAGGAHGCQLEVSEGAGGKGGGLTSTVRW